jgi:hypothetical protein
MKGPDWIVDSGLGKTRFIPPFAQVRMAEADQPL